MDTVVLEAQKHMDQIENWMLQSQKVFDLLLGTPLQYSLSQKSKNNPSYRRSEMARFWELMSWRQH